MQRQEVDCRELCQREQYEIVDVFVDDDRSAYSRKPRPAFEALKAAVADGKVDVIVAWHPDRLTRRLRELEDVIDLLDINNTTVRTVQSGEYDLSTASGKMTARVVGSVAQGESDHKSERLLRKHREIAEHGRLAGGGSRPFGYEQDRVTIREPEAAEIRRMVSLLLSGGSVRSITADLNERGSRTSTGTRWTPSKVRQVLSAARIAGLRSHNGEIVATAVWEGVIDADQYRRVMAILGDPTRRTNPGRPKRLLTGLVVCAECRTPMLSRPRADKRPTYICSKDHGGCGHMRILGDDLDDLVIDAVLKRLDSPTMVAALTPAADDARILDDLRGVESRRAELAALWAAGEISRAEWSAAGAALDKRQAALEAELGTATIAAHTPNLDGIPTLWPTMNTEGRRGVIDALIRSITISSAVRGRNTFDQTRVHVDWKG